MKTRKMILSLLICFSFVLTSFGSVFAELQDDLGMNALAAEDNAESNQEKYAISLMAEASDVDETLPSWNTNPTWEPINSDLNNESRYTVLMKILESTDNGDRYVRLNADISVSGDYGYGIAVKGKKVLDLNGHKLSIKLGKGEGYSGTQTAISISSGATLMVIDSKGGGKIFGDTWICDPVDMGYNRAATDLIYNKGTLIIHMPNGEIETGRSKKQWVTAAAEDGEYPDIAYARYSGYIRGQANGTAVIGTKNSTTVLVSGRVIGRGFYKFGTDAWNHDTPSEKCAAIETKGKFIMYGGEILGSGGADALRAYGGKGNTIVYSGNFRVKSLDKMAISAYKAYTPRPNYTKDCGYGYPISGERNFAPGSELILDDHETTVRPKSEMETTSDYITISHRYETSIIDLEKQSMWVVYAYYTPYFSQSGRNYLGYSKNPNGYDYKSSSFWKATAKFTVLDYHGNEIGYYNESNWLQDDYGNDKSAFRCDVLACKDKKGNPIAWEKRLTYTLRCTITETWDGDPEQKRIVYQDLNFRFWDSETQQVAKNLTFDFIPTKTATGEPTNYIIALNDSYVNEVKNSRISQMDVSYIYYEPIKNNKGEITGFEKKPEETLVYSESILDNDGTNYFPSKKVVLKPKTAGPIEVSIDLFTASGVKIETKTYKILSMPALTARFLSNEEYAVPEDGYTMTPQYQTWKVSMNSGIADFGKMTAYSILPSGVQWQYYDGDTKKFVDISSTDTRFEIKDSGNVLATNRTGEYRASYTFKGVRYYSPRTIFMNGTNFSNTRAPYISGPATTEYGDKATLTVKLNDNADWPAVSEYTLICRGQPSGAKVGTSSVTNTTGIFDIETSFFRLMNKDNFVPGNYTFEAKVRHADGVATSRRFVLTYEKTNTDFVFLVNGVQAEFNEATGESRYTLPTDCNGTFNVENGLYPRNSTKLKYPEKDYNYTIKNLTPEIISFSDGTATVLTPGDAKLSLEISRKTDGSVEQTVPLTVTIPIIGFEVEQPDYNVYLGQSWDDVRAEVKSVWGPGERKVTTQTDKYLTVSKQIVSGVGNKVAYNDKTDITWTARPNTGYRFAMKILESGYNTNGKKEYTMCADVYSIQTNNFTDTVKTAIEHKIYEANSSADFYYYTEGEPDGEDTHDPTNAKIYLTSKNAHVKDPNVQYIDVVSVTTSNPAVGDLRYEGTNPDKYYDEFMNVEIGTLSGVLNTDGNPIITAQTHVSKLDTVKGSGKPYDNAQDEDMGDYWKITNIVNGVANKPTERYETGIHKNWLRLETSGTDSSGTKYLFAPEMKLFVNGHLIEYAYVSYDTYTLASSRLDVYYYFDVGKVTQHTSATVDMTDVTPIAGEKPKGIENAFALNTNDVEITKFLWFVDANGNGKYDLGEEADSENGNLSADGKFLPNKKYSVDLEVGLAEGAEGRIAYPFSLNVKYDDLLGTVQQTKQQTVSSLDPNGVFTFPVTYIASVNETVDEPSDGSYNKYFAPINITAEEMPLKGYSLSSYYFRNLDGTSITEEFELTPGKQYWYVVSFSHAYDESWFSPLLTVVSIDGVPLVRGTSDTHSWYEVYSNITTIHYLYTVPGGGSTSDVTVNAIGIDASKYSVSGQTVTVTHDKACKLGYLDGDKYKAVAATKIEDGKYSFTVPDGVKEVILVVKGDANGDGKITLADSTSIKANCNGKKSMSKEALFASNVNSDDKITLADSTSVKADCNGKKSLGW